MIFSGGAKNIHNWYLANRMKETQINHGNESFALFTFKNGKLPLYFEKKEMKKLLESGMTLLNDDYRLHSEYVMVKPESYIYSVLNDFILQCHQYGFFNHFQSKKSKPLVLEIKDTSRKVLTMHMLSAGFYLWLMTVLLACVVFLIEHVVRYVSRTRHLVDRGEIEVYYDELDYDVDRTEEEKNMTLTEVESLTDTFLVSSGTFQNESILIHV